MQEDLQLRQQWEDLLEDEVVLLHQGNLKIQVEEAEEMTHLP